MDPACDFADAAFQHMRYLKGLPDLANALFGIAILRHAVPADHFEIGYLGEICQNIVLYAVGEVGVFFVVTKALERKHRDTFFQEGRRDRIRRK